MKLISFAIPCYNSAEYMEKCINSILKGGEDVEILIIDDGSTKDNTAEIADKYQEQYPNIVKAIHQENGGHGEAVNQGLRNATGLYYKVVDSDDWVKEKSLKEIISIIKEMKIDELPDCFIVNYVYEHVYNNTRKYIKYGHLFPKGRNFEFSESKNFPTGKFLAMHAMIYKTELLRNIKLELPKHTFYVDNIFVYTPMPYVKSFYYIDTNFYRYFIGRPDQSVNESIIMKRIDQHIRVTKEMVKAHKLDEIKLKDKKLYNYMLDYVSIMMTIN
ncbi:MAG: glycosyltransferase family 2 protein, partial [Firmicutes bacterium]|nr:glycosyltransferase family 2 protein [Candidatus Caballimonas caccae]